MPNFFSFPACIDQFILNPKSKEDKVKMTNLTNFPKLQIFKFWRKKTLHATHLLKLLDKMCKYEMDLASIVEDTERTGFCPQTQTDWRTRWNQYTPFQLRWAERGYNERLVYRYINHLTLMSLAPFSSHGLTSIPAWISNYIHYKQWHEITYPFLNFNGCTVEV